MLDVQCFLFSATCILLPSLYLCLSDVNVLLQGSAIDWAKVDTKGVNISPRNASIQFIYFTSDLAVLSSKCLLAYSPHTNFGTVTKVDFGVFRKRFQ